MRGRIRRIGMEEREERLRQWALEYGSPELREKAERGYGWRLEAEEEFVLSVLEHDDEEYWGWWKPLDFSGETEVVPRRHPSRDEITALNRVWADMAELPVELSLGWARHQYQDRGTWFWTGPVIIIATITLPNGMKVKWFREVEDARTGEPKEWLESEVRD
jgi:hypothetical protein